MGDDLVFVSCAIRDGGAASPAVLGAATLLLGGCGSMNSALTTKKQSIEHYRIFDVRTAANRSKVVSAASSGLSQNVGGISEARPIPKSSKPPEDGRRFCGLTLVEPFSRAILAVAVGSSITGKRVEAVLEHLAKTHGLPQVITT
jgi:hypothetical protein